ncbi:MAG: OmpA family protein [Pseudomonas sp.]|uniref:OmpA family protein n=1 Tax=Pseudomonas sp. TaxID=306 RepID=UPI002732537F|nr:OmpA family protein [Pseudomonas sp.]MDP3847961.1 OmpA family protein [Pseudomonas sp.]
MKLKNTLGVVIASLVAATSINAMAQGQGAVEAEAFAKYYAPDSSRDLGNHGNLLGGSLGYYLTDDVELALSYGEYHDIRGEDSGKNVKGSLSALDAVYNFGAPGVGLRPYVSAGFAHQSIGQDSTGGRDRSTFANVGTGVKYYFTENVFAKASLDGMYNIDAGNSEYMAGLGVGVNFGGGTKPAAVAPVAAVAEVCNDSDNDGVCDADDKCPGTEANATVDSTGCVVVAEAVRVELDVKFDFDKAVVKQDSYGDIKSLADFMQQYPKTTTTVEGHTDSVGTDAYNQSLSTRRADAVRAVLVNQYGVAGDRVNAVGHGEAKPVADNATEAGRAVNRRVEAGVEAAQ